MNSSRSGLRRCRWFGLAACVFAAVGPMPAQDRRIADFVPDPASVTRFEQGLSYPQAGFQVVHIEGAPLARGRQHGRLLAGQRAFGLRPDFAVDVDRRRKARRGDLVRGLYFVDATQEILNQLYALFAVHLLSLSAAAKRRHMYPVRVREQGLNSGGSRHKASLFEAL